MYSRGGELDVVEALPWPAAANEFGLVEADQGFGGGVVVGVALAAYRADRAGGVEAFGVADRQVLPGLNRWLHHLPGAASVGARRGLRRVSSSPGSCVVCC